MFFGVVYIGVKKKKMKFKSRYKSCIWSRKDVWGNLGRKNYTFLRVKWDRMMGIIKSRGYKRRQRICKDYGFVQPATRANQTFQYGRWGFKNSLSNRLCARRFFGDLGHRTFRKLSQVKTSLNLCEVLESRLDINLYRLGFFPSIYFSRQAILHGKLLVNGEKVTFGHFSIKFGDIVEFTPQFRAFIIIQILRQRRKSKYISNAGLKYYKFSNLNLWHPKRRLKMRTTPWILTDYANLIFLICGKIQPFLIYPYRLDLDELVSYANYGY